MAAKIAELRIPADPRYILVAKRSAVAFGSIIGLDIEALDDLSIAVAQACENAIAMTKEWVDDCVGELRLEFAMSPEAEGLEVRVRAVCPKTDSQQGESDHGTSSLPAALPGEHSSQEDAAAMLDMGLRLMQLFVDDCRYRVDEQHHGVHIRLTKYRLL